MKKTICLLLAACLLFALAACGGKQPEPESKEWTRQGYFTDENEDILSVTWMEDIDEPGWYVGVMTGEIMGGCTLPQVGNALHGDLNAWDESAEPLIVTVSEEGADGLLLTIEGGESYHFIPLEIPTATIVVTVNTEGWGYIAYAEGEEIPEIDPEYPAQSAYIGLAEPATYTFVAGPEEGNLFVKWTKNGEDVSTEPQITVLLDESADYVAVFEGGFSLANPWTDVDSAQAAAEGAGVGDFTLPEAGMEIDGGLIGWYGYRCMDLLAEADGYVGAAELTVRKGVNGADYEADDDTADVSGDYNVYGYEWTTEAMGRQVRCFGNEEGRTMKAIWSSDGFSYCILVRGQGDIRDTYGLGADDIAALVGAIG